VDSQVKCDDLGVFLAGLPQDVIVLLAVQDSAWAGNRTLPISNLTAVGAEDAGNVTAQTLHAVIGYKGQQAMAWKRELRKNSGSGPAEVSSSIPISCSYVPEGDAAKSVKSRFYLGFILPHPRQNFDGFLRGIPLAFAATVRDIAYAWLRLTV